MIVLFLYGFPRLNLFDLNDLLGWALLKNWCVYLLRIQSKRKRPRTPTPGNYLGLKSSRDGKFPTFLLYRSLLPIMLLLLPFSVWSYLSMPVLGFRGRYRGGYGREDYSGYCRSPRRSPYLGGRDYSPRRSPYGVRSRRDRSRSLPYSPYRSPDRGSYGRRANVYAR